MMKYKKVGDTTCAEIHYDMSLDIICGRAQDVDPT